jgi:hypothetical protein
MKSKTTVILAAVLAVSLGICSCFGVKSQTLVKADGSGQIDLEYKVSKMFSALGTLDGNQGMPTLPVGEADFRRTAEKIDGLSGKSFKSRETETDTVYSVKLEFAKLESLAAFLDAQGTKASVSMKDGKTTLALMLGDNKALDPQMKGLAVQLLEGYTFDFALTLPAACRVSFLDAAGRETAAFPYGKVAVSSKSMRFTASMSEVVSSVAQAGITITW